MKTNNYLILLGILVYISSSLCIASQDLYDFTNPQQSNDFINLTKQLRCTVCQNQSLYDSMAPLAVDLKDQIYDMLLDGKNETEISKFLVDRYGDFVLYSPPLKQRTALLWFAPVLLLGVGICVLVISVRSKSYGG